MKDQEASKEKINVWLTDSVIQELSNLRKSPTKLTEARYQWAIKAREYHKDFLVTGYKRAVAEGMEEAFFYDPLEEFQRLYRTNEITRDEYDNNPLRIANKEYIGRLRGRAGDLAAYCIIAAFSNFKRAPGLKSVVNKAIQIAKEELTDIHNETGIGLKVIALSSMELFQRIAFTGFIIFEYERWKMFSSELTELATLSQSMSMELRGVPEGSAEEEAIRAKIGSIEDHEYEIGEIYENEKRKALEGVTFIENSQDFLEDFIKTLYVQDGSSEQKLNERSGSVEISEGVGVAVEGKRDDFPLLAAEISRIEREQSSISPYSYLINSQAFTKSQAVINQPGRVSSVNPKEITYREEFKTGNKIISYKTAHNDIEWVIPQDLEKIENGVKLFNFFGKKANENPAHDGTAHFMLQELIDLGIYKNKDTAINGIRSSVKLMQRIIINGSVNGYEKGKPKLVRAAGGPIVGWQDLTRKQCKVTLAPIFQSGYIPITAITDPNFFKLSDRAHMLLAYIGSQARMKQNARSIKTKGCFNIGLESIRIHLGLPTMEQAKKHPKQLIVDKIEAAIAEAADSAGMEGLKITVVSDYLDKLNEAGDKQTKPSVALYLKGYLKIEVDEATREIMTKRADDLEDEIKKMAQRKEKAIQKLADKAEEAKAQNGEISSSKKGN